MMGMMSMLGRMWVTQVQWIGDIGRPMGKEGRGVCVLAAPVVVPKS